MHNLPTSHTIPLSWRKLLVIFFIMLHFLATLMDFKFLPVHNSITVINATEFEVIFVCVCVCVHAHVCVFTIS